jgi:nitroreductase
MRIRQFVLTLIGVAMMGDNGMSESAPETGNEAEAVSVVAAMPDFSVVLPTPRQTGGMPLLDALKQRRSVRSFSEKPIPEQLLSDLLWAAFGVNRPESRMRTAPSSYNWQDVMLYVFTPEGVWTYEAAGHRLLNVRRGDHRKLAGLQSYVWAAPLSIVYVSDYSTMKHGDESFSIDYKLKIGAIDAGHISQNVYLFCASEGLGAVARASVDTKAFAEAFSLSVDQQVILGQTIGWPEGE